MATKKAVGEKKKMVVTLVDPNAIEPWIEDFLRRIEENDANGVRTVVSARRDAVGVHNAVSHPSLSLPFFLLYFCSSSRPAKPPSSSLVDSDTKSWSTF